MVYVDVLDDHNITRDWLMGTIRHMVIWRVYG